MSARLCRLLALAGSMLAILAAAPSANAAVQWNDGEFVTSTLHSCVQNIWLTGADAVVGYQADPASLPRAGDVFYAHVGFGAAIDACGNNQGAEVDLVLPPGVSLAIDASHPIRCLYEDSGQSAVSPNPTCPTHTIGGVYGSQIPSDDAGDAWSLPPGRFFLVQVPLRSTRQLKGPAGGYCPASVSEISSYPNNDCLLAALHFADGSTDPWLVPQEPLFIDPAAAVTPPSGGGGSVTPPPSGTVAPPRPGDTVTPPAQGSSKPVRVTLSIHQHLRAILRGRAIQVSCSLSAAGRCELVVSVTARQARALHLRVKHGRARYTLGQASKRMKGAGRTTERVKLSRKLVAALRKTRKLSIRVQVTVIDVKGHSRTTTRGMTLRR